MKNMFAGLASMMSLIDPSSFGVPKMPLTHGGALSVKSSMPLSCMERISFKYSSSSMRKAGLGKSWGEGGGLVKIVESGEPYICCSFGLSNERRGVCAECSGSAVLSATTRTTDVMHDPEKDGCKLGRGGNGDDSLGPIGDGIGTGCLENMCKWVSSKGGTLA